MPDGVRELDCKSTLEKLWDYLDQELDDVRMREIEHHLHNCAHCFKNSQLSERLFHAINSTGTRRRVPAELRSQVLASLKQAGYKAS